MKKTIIALMALTGVASAASVDASKYASLGLSSDLTAAYDFTTGEESTGDLKLSTAFSVDNGLAMLGSGKNMPWQKSALTIGSDVNKDWTISFDLVSLGNNGDWANLLAIYSSSNTGQGYNTSMTFSMDNNNQFRITSDNGGEGTFGGNSAITLNTGIYDADKAGSDVTYATGQTITLVQDGASKTLTLYINGIQTAQATEWTAASIVGMQFGASFGNRDAMNSASIDNLAIWGKALQADQVSSLIVSSPSDNVPEPTTATLSLLALAGLAARRRRK